MRICIYREKEKEEEKYKGKGRSNWLLYEMREIILPL